MMCEWEAVCVLRGRERGGREGARHADGHPMLKGIKLISFHLLSSWSSPL
jgi:hypothetical protein